MTKKAKEEAVESLIKTAEQKYEEMEFEEALASCQKVLKSSPQNIKALSIGANSLMELDQHEEAKAMLNKLIQLDPDDPEAYDRHLQLGQLSADQEALNYYKKGIELLQKRLQDAQEEAKAELKVQLGDAYASIANLYMNDLCDEENAEDETKKHLDLCMEAHPTSDSGAIAMCSFLKITGKSEEAKKVLLTSYGRWGPILSRYCQQLEVEEDEPDDQLLQQLPPFEEMFNAAKLLVELLAVEEAEESLTNLLMMDNPDHTVELLYVLANFFLLRHKDSETEDSDELLLAARKYLHEMVELAEERPHSPEMVKHAQELLEELNEKLGPMSESENEDEILGSDYETDEEI